MLRRMNTTWDWAKPIREKYFSTPLAGEFTLEPVENAEAYWRLHQETLKQHFPAEVFFDLQGLRGEEGKRAQHRLLESMNANRLQDYWAARKDGEVILMFSSHQVDEHLYRMWHSHLHPKYRGRGIYKDYLQRMIAYTKELGFEAIVSEHAPNNNAVLIAKLKAGFRIYSMEIDPMVGVSICLRYFHVPEHLAAYEFRCGYATLNENLLAHGMGAMPQLVQQFKAWGKP